MIPRSVALAAAIVLSLLAMPAAQAGGGKFDATVQAILAEPYQADYVPQGNDTAFENAPNTLPAEDYTSGSVAGDPDFPGWPTWFHQVLFRSADGAPLYGQLGLHAGKHPGVVVVHGFNTNGYDSVVRWAAMLYANGYDVLAADQRDFSAEYAAGYGYPAWQQTFGWKESEDVLAAGRYLAVLERSGRWKEVRQTARVADRPEERRPRTG